MCALLADELSQPFRQPVSERLRAASAVATVTVPAGAWQPPLGDGGLTLAIVDGFLNREYRVTHRRAAELLGSGDLMLHQELEPDAAASRARGQHTAHRHRRLAGAHPPRLRILDTRFLTRLAAHPASHHDAPGPPRRPRRLAGRVDGDHGAAQAGRRLLALVWVIADR